MTGELTDAPADPGTPGPGAVDVVLRLRSLEELFAAPAFDPWTGAGARERGIDRLLDAARAAPDPRRVRLRLTLPAGVGGPGRAGPAGGADGDVAGRTAAAIRRWCEEEIAAYDRALAVLRRRDRAAFVAGAVWLAACLALAGVVDSLDGLPHALRLVAGEGLVIAGWVGMWKPIDILVYDRAEARRERRVLAALRDVPVAVEVT